MKNTFELKKGDKLILKKELETDFFAPHTSKFFKCNIIDIMRKTLKLTKNIITVNSILDDTIILSKEDGYKYDVTWFDKYDDNM